MSTAAKKNCYAMMWSYGNICVNSGCCERGNYKARLDYHRELLKEDCDQARINSIVAWDNPAMVALQLGNIASNIRHELRKIKELEKKVAAKDAQKGGTHD